MMDTMKDAKYQIRYHVFYTSSEDGYVDVFIKGDYKPIRNKHPYHTNVDIVMCQSKSFDTL